MVLFLFVKIAYGALDLIFRVFIVLAPFHEIKINYRDKL